ncbi:MAG: toll/interleukin-1 receptor domain-containing protein [Verrucomicrobia bacterium]|nr:toll/interleukin-1 receptor domain-containing protein [Verrucomicrobiota bacterium]
MRAVPPAANPKRDYWCFISYRHADNKQPGRQWATWLHQALENYEVPTDLVGTPNQRGDVIPERIFPVFRDEEELPADADLSQPIERALQHSMTLLVLCSPRAVKSEYVAKEILGFKKLGKHDRILAAMIDGEPNATDNPEKGGVERECFPVPLRFKLDPQAEDLGTEHTEPVAADFRLPDGSEGWTTPAAYRESLRGLRLPEKEINARVAAYSKQQSLMLLKIIAGVLGIDLGMLTKRDMAYQLERQKQRARTLRNWLILVGAVGLAAVALGLMARHQQQEAQAQQKAAVRQTGIATLRNASLLIPAREFARANEALENVPPAQRGWEWHSLKRRLDARDAVYALKDLPPEAGFGLIMFSVLQNPYRELEPVSGGGMGVRLMPWAEPVRLALPPGDWNHVHLQAEMKHALVMSETRSLLVPVQELWYGVFSALWPEPMMEERKKHPPLAADTPSFDLGGPVHSAAFTLEGVLHALREGGIIERWKQSTTNPGVWELQQRRQEKEDEGGVLWASPDGKHLVQARTATSGIRVSRLDPLTLQPLGSVDGGDAMHPSAEIHDATLLKDGRLMLAYTSFETWNHRRVGGTLCLQEFSPEDMKTGARPVPETEDDDAAGHAHLLYDEEHTFTSLTLPAEVSYPAPHDEELAPASGPDAAAEPEEEEEKVWASIAEWEGGSGLLLSWGVQSHRLEGFGTAPCIATVAAARCLYTLHANATVGEWIISNHLPPQRGDSAELSEDARESTQPSDYSSAPDGRFFPSYDVPNEGGSYSTDSGLFPGPGSSLIHLEADEDRHKTLRHIDFNSGGPVETSLKAGDLVDPSGRLPGKDEDFDPYRRQPDLWSRRNGRLCAMALTEGTLYGLFLHSDDPLLAETPDPQGHRGPGEHPVIGAWDAETDEWLTYYGFANYTEADTEAPEDEKEPLYEVLPSTSPGTRRLRAVLEDGQQVVFEFALGLEASLSALSPDGRRRAVVNGRRLTIHDAADNALLLEHPLSNHVANPRLICWSEDGQLLGIAFGGSDPARIGCMVWDGRAHAFHDAARCKLVLVMAEANEKKKAALGRIYAQSLASSASLGTTLGIRWDGMESKDVEAIARSIMRGKVSNDRLYEGKTVTFELSEENLRAALPHLRFHPETGIEIIPRPAQIEKRPPVSVAAPAPLPGLLSPPTQPKPVPRR